MPCDGLTTILTVGDAELVVADEVAPEVQQALTRDYSALMKAIDAKKGR